MEAQMTEQSQDKLNESCYFVSVLYWELIYGDLIV